MELLAANFHYFRETTYPSGIYPISREALMLQIDALSKEYAFISQDKLVGYIRNDSFPEGKYCLLTFDDGLKEQMEAFFLLEKLGIPAIFFVPTQPIEEGHVLEVHQLHHIRAHKDDRFLFEMLDKAFHISNWKFDAEVLATQYRYDDQLGRKVKYFLNFELDETKRKVFINQIFNELVYDAPAFARQLYMDKEDLKLLARAGALGSHGSTHQPLAKMSAEEARQDVEDSLNLLEQWTGQKPSSFSYPYGGKTAVSPEAGAILKENGVTLAFTMNRGINSDNDLRKNTLFLKRLDTNDAPGGKNHKRTLN